MKAALVTCRRLPDLDPDDHPLRDELDRRGHQVTAAIWDDPAVDWAGVRRRRAALDLGLPPSPRRVPGLGGLGGHGDAAPQPAGPRALEHPQVLPSRAGDEGRVGGPHRDHSGRRAAGRRGADGRQRVDARGGEAGGGRGLLRDRARRPRHHGRRPGPRRRPAPRARRDAPALPPVGRGSRRALPRAHRRPLLARGAEALALPRRASRRSRGRRRRGRGGRARRGGARASPGRGRGRAVRPRRPRPRRPRAARA